MSEPFNLNPEHVGLPDVAVTSLLLYFLLLTSYFLLLTSYFYVLLRTSYFLLAMATILTADDNCGANEEYVQSCAMAKMGAETTCNHAPPPSSMVE